MNRYGRPAPRPESGASPAYMESVLGIKRVKSTTPSNSQPIKKRKVIDLTQDDDEEDEVAAAAAQASLAGLDPAPKKERKKKGEPNEEKRLRRFRQNPPQSYIERLGRVRTQRMFLIERNRTTTDDGTFEEEVFDIAGTTGNVYQVAISKLPNCSCPDASKGNHCKHIVYVMINVLKAREDLAYQLALLSTELGEIFANAPVTKQSNGGPMLSTDTGGSRKAIVGDCLVCVMEFEEGEDLIWCKAACGQNIHRHCFEQWQRSKPGQQVKCVYCRSLWKDDTKSIKKISKGGEVNKEGYVNVAEELGINQHRDMSSYHPFWFR